MPDPRFFENHGPFTVADLCSRFQMQPWDKRGKIKDINTIQIRNVSALDHAENGDITFLENIKYQDQLWKTKATACIVHKEFADKHEGDLPEGILILTSKHPYMSYAYIAQAFFPHQINADKTTIAESANVSSNAVIGENVTIDSGAVVAEGVRIGDCVHIGAGTIIQRNVEIGDFTRIGDNVVITHSIIGKSVHIYSGCCIGQDGFGFAIDPSGFVKIPQLGRVVIEDSVNIGANTTIDRGSLQDTVIGQGTWIDNLVQIAHNVKIGKCCVIVAQAGISGSTVLEDHVVVAGQVGVAGHLRIGKGAKIAAKSGVMKNIEAGEEQMGYPAQPIRSFMKQAAMLKRLVKKGT